MFKYPSFYLPVNGIFIPEKKKYKKETDNRKQNKVQTHIKIIPFLFNDLKLSNFFTKLS